MPTHGTKNSFFKKYSLAIYLLGGLIILWIVLEFLGFGMLKNTPAFPSPVSTTARTFTASAVMGGFTIDVPEGFEVEEKFTTVSMKKNNNEILVTFTGTDYKSLQEVISSLNRETGNITFLIIDDKSAAVETSTSRKAYYIYKDYALYSIFTNSPSFYPDLDQIVQSFRLPGN